MECLNSLLTYVLIHRVKYDREGCSNAKSSNEDNQKGSGAVRMYVEYV